MTARKVKRIAWGTVYASIVGSAALLMSAWQGSFDWMALLVLLFFLVPQFRDAAMQFIRGQTGNEKPEPHHCDHESHQPNDHGHDDPHAD